MNKKSYIIYDERAYLEGTDNAAVMVACGSMKEAKTYAGQYGIRCPVYSYDIQGDDLINEEFVDFI